jgi:hypothetical protein
VREDIGAVWVWRALSLWYRGCVRVVRGSAAMVE